MLDQTLTLPEDPEELRSFTARLLAEVKAQAILIEKLRHQLAGHRAHRFRTDAARVTCFLIQFFAASQLSVICAILPHHVSAFPHHL